MGVCVQAWCRASMGRSISHFFRIVSRNPSESAAMGCPLYCTVSTTPTRKVEVGVGPRGRGRGRDRTFPRCSERAACSSNLAEQAQEQRKSRRAVQCNAAHCMHPRRILTKLPCASQPGCLRPTEAEKGLLYVPWMKLPRRAA